MEGFRKTFEILEGVLKACKAFRIQKHQDSVKINWNWFKILIRYTGESKKKFWAVGRMLWRLEKPQRKIRSLPIIYNLLRKLSKILKLFKNYLELLDIKVVILKNKVQPLKLGVWGTAPHIRKPICHSFTPLDAHVIKRGIETEQYLPRGVEN